MHTHKHTHVHTYEPTCTNTPIQPSIHPSTHDPINTRALVIWVTSIPSQSISLKTIISYLQKIGYIHDIHAYMHAPACAQTRIYIYVYIYIYIYIYMYTYIYIYTNEYVFMVLQIDIHIYLSWFRNIYTHINLWWRILVVPRTSCVLVYLAKVHPSCLFGSSFTIEQGIYIYIYREYGYPKRSCALS